MEGGSREDRRKAGEGTGEERKRRQKEGDRSERPG